MQLPDGSRTTWGNRVIALGLVALMAGSVFAGMAAAEPAMGFQGSELSATTVTVGENVTVTASVVNVGSSGGGYTFEFERNGTDFAEQRIQVPQGEVRSVNATIQFDSPGTYRITVNDNRAGFVTVKPARARVASENDTQRRIDIRANGVSTTDQTELDVPSSNRTVSLVRWSPTTGESAFQQYLTEYTDRSAVSAPLPAPESSTLLGVVDFESEDGFEQATMQIAVNDSVLENASLDSDEVTIYQRNGTSWERLSTTASTASGANRTVYEATATRGTTYAIGRIDPVISIANTSVETTTGNGDIVTLDAVLRNDGVVAGEYVGVLRVNGDEVNRTTVTVPAAGTTTITLSHRLTEAGTYNVRLNQSRSTQVIITDGPGNGVQTPSTETTATPTAAATAAAGGDNSGSGLPGPATVLGINTAYVVGGIAIALGAFVAILLMLRRGDSGGSDSFDQL